ncbi:hypothetical protein [Sagittula stellata]|uniref:Uncharacterized protein n=1 Tax=Sagittula stellata (strain ATCC 700073 / DSM 11524 / E-37) TaxID=388399 RepID=A3K0Q8_SAGS3|nr:hypothetical protein SSE37_24064 [Sagittula stellata E-37]
MDEPKDHRLRGTSVFDLTGAQTSVWQCCSESCRTPAAFVGVAIFGQADGRSRGHYNATRLLGYIGGKFGGASGLPPFDTCADGGIAPHFRGTRFSDPEDGNPKIAQHDRGCADLGPAVTGPA